MILLRRAQESCYPKPCHNEPSPITGPQHGFAFLALSADLGCGVGGPRSARHADRPRSAQAADHDVSHLAVVKSAVEFSERVKRGALGVDQLGMPGGVAL